MGGYPFGGVDVTRSPDRMARLSHNRGMPNRFVEHLRSELAGLESAGLYKHERILASPQSAEIEVGGRKVLNFCANNYLGLADHPEAMP